MRALPWLFLGGSLALSAAATQPPMLAGNSEHGAQLFQSEHCVECHSINGKGGKIAPDLGKLVDRNFTPALLASTMWNHAPLMWTTMEKHGVEKPRLTPQDAADLFAFFYSTRFFDQPGDAGRGKAVFASKHCGDCHGITASNAEGAPPVAKWESLGHPIVLVQQMWNHSASMKAAFARRKLAWPELNNQELSDLLVYLRNLPETRQLSTGFTFTEGEGGPAIFQSKGCANCHKGNLALENRLHNQTLTGIAVDMWNHAPLMKQPPPTLTADEMRSLLSYLWLRQFVATGGNPARGKQVFTQKHCVECHEAGRNGAPPLAGQARPLSEITIMSALWQHGPQMYERMRQNHIAWPRFNNAQQMSDLLAYVDSIQ